MAQMAADAQVEMSLFARPNAGWGLSATARAHAGFAAPSWGQDQIVAGLEDCTRAALHGFRSVLIADIGLLDVFGAARGSLLPADMQAKVSVMLPASNPASARVMERLGASTINLPTDLTLAQIAAIRAAVEIPLDIYVEAPDNVGGYLRYHEIPELIRIAAPIYIKFGLRNAPDVYPGGERTSRRRRSRSHANACVALAWAWSCWGDRGTRRRPPSSAPAGARDDAPARSLGAAHFVAVKRTAQHRRASGAGIAHLRERERLAGSLPPVDPELRARRRARLVGEVDPRGRGEVPAHDDRAIVRDRVPAALQEIQSRRAPSGTIPTWRRPSPST